MATLIKVPIEVNGVELCNEEKDIANGWWWTDIRFDAADFSLIVPDTKFSLEGITTGDDWAAFGFIGAPCWDYIDIIISWSFAPFSTVTAKVDIVDNVTGLTNVWTWVESTHGRFGNTTESINIQNVGACGAYILTTLNADDNSDTLTIEINQFS